jgi:cysteine desulfurase/selenocysteine lyase
VYPKLAKFFHANEQEFVNVRNCTEAINAVALGNDWKENDEIIVTDIEHHSNLLPWLKLGEKGVKVKIIKSDEQGIIDANGLNELICKKTKLVSFSACSNVVGAQMPIEQMVKISKDAGALVMIDAAQHVGHHALDLSKVKADYIAFSAHKCFGPTGVGVLYHREGAPLNPWFLGGGTIRQASLEKYKLIENRERFEAGTPAIAEWIGLGAAIDTISKIGYSNIEAHEKAMINAMLKVFARAKNVQLYGPAEAQKKACALFAFNVKGVEHHQTAVMLDKFAFALRSGHHCAMPLTKKLGVDGTVRASLHIYNDEKQVQKFAEALEKISMLS